MTDKSERVLYRVGRAIARVVSWPIRSISRILDFPLHKNSFGQEVTVGDAIVAGAAATAVTFASSRGIQTLHAMGIESSEISSSSQFETDHSTSFMDNESIDCMVNEILNLQQLPSSHFEHANVPSSLSDAKDATTVIESRSPSAEESVLYARAKKRSDEIKAENLIELESSHIPEVSIQGNPAPEISCIEL